MTCATITGTFDTVHQREAFRALGAYDYDDRGMVCYRAVAHVAGREYLVVCEVQHDPPPFAWLNSGARN